MYCKMVQQQKSPQNNCGLLPVLNSGCGEKGIRTLGTV